MAIKVKRKQTRRQTAKEPDQIYTVSERVFNALETNRKTVLLALAGILVAIIVITTIASRTSRSTVDEGALVLDAALIGNAPVGEPLVAPEGDDDQERLSFETREARAEALRVALGEALGDSEPPTAVRLLDAIASVTLGDMTRAGAGFEAAASTDLPLISAVALQGRAATQAHAGQSVAAEDSLQRMSEKLPGLEDFVAMERARLAEAAGNLEAARAAYQDIASRGGLVIGEGGISSGNEALAAAAGHRANVLGLLLGRGAAGDDDSAEPEGTAPNDSAPDDSVADDSAPAQSDAPIDTPPAAEGSGETAGEGSGEPAEAVEPVEPAEPAEPAAEGSGDAVQPEGTGDDAPTSGEDGS